MSLENIDKRYAEITSDRRIFVILAGVASIGVIAGLFAAMYLFLRWNVFDTNFYFGVLIFTISVIAAGICFPKSKEYKVEENRYYFYVFYGIHLALDQYNANKKKKNSLRKKFSILLQMIKEWVPYDAPEIFVPKIPQSLTVSIKDKALIAIEEGIDMSSILPITKDMAIKGFKGELTETDWIKFDDSLKSLQTSSKEKMEQKRKISSKPFQLLIIAIGSVFVGFVSYQVLITLGKTPADAFIAAIGVSIALVPAILAAIHFYKK